MTLTIPELVDLIYEADPRPSHFYQNIMSFIPLEHRQNMLKSADPATLDEQLRGATDNNLLELLHQQTCSDLLTRLMVSKLNTMAHPDDIEVISGESVLWTVRRIMVRLNRWFKQAPHVSPKFLYEWFLAAYSASNDACFQRLRDVHGSKPPHFLKNIRQFIKYIEPLMNEMGYIRVQNMRRPMLKWWDLEEFGDHFGVDYDTMITVREKTKTSQSACFWPKSSSV